ncbi:MAG: type II toxin-antitoxin system VapC family toxin [Armatimonadota bacterium]
MRLVIDSNIFVSALDPNDVFHSDCYPVIERLLSREVEAVCPLLVLVEVTCVLRRRTGSEPLARSVLRSLLQWPSIEWLDITREAAEHAAALGARTGVRAGDALILRVAEQYDIPLLTKDKEMKQKRPESVQVIDTSDMTW